MGTMTVRNLPDDVHRRVKFYAVERGLSAEAAARELLDKATRPTEKLGDILAEYARQHDAMPLDIKRDQNPVRAVTFE